MHRRFNVAFLLSGLFAGFLLLSEIGLAASVQSGQQQAIEYTCPMHPEVKSKSPRRCPKCRMALRATAVKPSPPEASAVDPAKEPGQLPLSLQIPDTVVYDQTGRQLRFFSDLVKGKTVAINFIFTTCTTICPPLTATFRKVQQQLGERVGRDVRLISISVDPGTDVPERLRNFAARFNAGPGWSFITGSQQEISQLLRALGAGVGDKNDHTQMILVGNQAAGYWTRANGLAPPAKLVAAINDAAGHKVESALNSTAPVTADGAKKALSPAESAAHYFPNSVLLTQDGKAVRFFDDLLKDKTVLINFMFATCTGVCPVMAGNLAKVQAQLDGRVGRDIHLISISVDPLVDTPEVLKRYAGNFKAQPGWYFLTGKKEDVDRVLYKLGGYVEDKSQHTNIMIIGNATSGEWAKIPALSNPAEIVRLALKIADARKE